MTEIAITRTERSSGVRYAASLPGIDGEGELTLTRKSDTVFIADHTGVPDSMRGIGVGQALVARMVADARAAGQRVVPQCPFVRAQARRHRDDWADVIQW